LEYTSYHSWAALSIGRRYGIPFADSTSTGLLKYIQPAQAEDSMDPVSSYTESVVIDVLWGESVNYISYN
jgi:hypothetical protein